MGGLKVQSPGAEKDLNESFLGVPLYLNGKSWGAVSVQSYKQHAYGENDLRLLNTLVSSMSVALENARLLDETQRLLKQTEQRAAELAVINSIQEGMAAELNFQGIIDLAGDKLREVFRTGDIGIRWHDPKTGLIHFLYEYEHGTRLDVAPGKPMQDGPWSKIVATRQPVVHNSRAASEAAGIGAIPGTDMSESSVFVPIVGSDRVLGLIILEDYERENAFGEAEVRLLSTVAASMGVALENARLFDETQRLFKESEQRAAELAIINTVQQALAAELNIQGIYEAVGDKIREIFPQTDLSIRIYDPKTDLIHYPYTFEEGRRVTIDAGRALRQGGIRTARPAYARDARHQREHGRGGDEVRGRRLSRDIPHQVRGIRAAGVRRPGARADQSLRHAARERLRRFRRAVAADARGRHERGARKREALRRDAAPLQGKRAARRRARDHQQRAGGTRRRAEHAGHLRRGGRQDPRDLPAGGHGHSHL